MVNISATLLAMGVPCGEDTPPPPLTRLNVLDFEEHVEGPLRSGGRQSCNSGSFWTRKIDFLK